MAVNPMYAKGYRTGHSDGYEKGLKDGLHGSPARLVMERDLIFIYGVMAIVLVEKHHWKQQSVENLIQEIQTQWRKINGERPEEKTMTMAELVEHRTGISLQQFAEDILDGGWEE
jgi:hypothetical protein